MVCLRELNDRHPASALKAMKPRVEVIDHSDLIIAVTLQEKERLGDRPGGGYFVVTQAAQVIGR